MTSREHPTNPDSVAFAMSLRETYRAALPLAGAPDPVAEVRALKIASNDPGRQIDIRVYVPMLGETAQRRPIVLFAHGGGFVSGDLDTHDVMARAIANGALALVVSVDYRLAPEHPFPAGLEDVYEVLCWLKSNAHEISGDGRRIVLCGDSAGANIAAATAIMARDQKGPAIVAQWLMYPTLSHRRDTGSWQTFGDTHFPSRDVMAQVVAAYIPRPELRATPLAEPLSAELHNLPPALLQMGECDPLRDEGLDYAEALNRAGVKAMAKVYPKQQHGFIQFYKDVEHHSLGRLALDEGCAFVRQALAAVAG